jgi:DNA polymerase III delta prime subunit
LADLPANETPTNDVHDHPDYEYTPTDAQPAKAQKKRTRKSEDTKEKKERKPHARNQASLDMFTRPAQAQQADQAAAADMADATETKTADDLNLDRTKRRKTKSPDPECTSTSSMPSPGWHPQLQVEMQRPIFEATTTASTELLVEDNNALLRSASPVPRAATIVEPIEIAAELHIIGDKTTNVTPKKQIKITKTGKLVSSPPKTKVEESTTPKKRRGRKPAKALVSPTVTIIKYGSDPASRQALGAKIEAILSCKKPTSKRLTVTKKATQKPAKPTKGTHPFFVGKADQKPVETSATSAVALHLPTPRKSAVTPGKLRAEAMRDRLPGPTPAFGMSSGANRVTKQSGLLEASWPTREMAHVRNLESGTRSRSESNMPRVALRTRKLKNRVVTLAGNEDLISRLAEQLKALMHVQSKEVKSDFMPPEHVRLPTRLLTTGVEIQRRVWERLHSQFLARQSIHPAITALFADIEHTLTPFDEGRCEGQTWVQKYSPKCVSHVLNTGKEATVLKDWLQSLTVMAVGGAQGSVKPDTLDLRRPPKKKRKKAFDDFIVSDDDTENEEMVELSSYENRPQGRSFRRPRWTRSKNVILISGSHGCGKSATVYAVAKELDFEIFEINSGTRRSGKDIQDRVGDMTANHLVNHKRNDEHMKEEVVLANDIDTDNDRMSTALQNDIDSGRQGTMMTFFTTNPVKKAKLEVKPKLPETNKAPPIATQAMLPKLSASHKSQKQSLILVEEADVLFDEDQQFWSQITKLAAHSKRPIVITCNDERQIPVQDLPLAAVLRLQPPPVDLAVDYMLVLAGREGHILERQAVSDLYKSKNYDLRGSITELNLWCQMSVGDRKGGLEWMYQRWPPGKDIDSDGRLLRVASEGTYQPGMGWLSHNVFETKDNAVFDKEEELLNEVWADWGIHPTDWEASSVQLPAAPLHGSLKDLNELDDLTETLSAADVYSRVGLPTYACDYNEPADSTLPPIIDKARLSYTLAAPVLQADRQLDFFQFDTSICTQTHLLARRVYPELSRRTSSSTSHIQLTETDYTRSILRIKETNSKKHGLSRPDYSYAFDVLAALPDQVMPERSSFNLTPSSFDRTFKIITLELAPYVRSIVAHEQTLEAQRIHMSNLLSGGGTAKRARTTRASRVALEGGVRETKRRDRWFDTALNFELVMATAGKEWTGMGWRSEEDESGEGAASLAGTQESTSESQDIVMMGAEGEHVHE